MTYKIQIVFDYNRRAYIDATKLEMKQIAKAFNVYNEEKYISVKRRIYQPEIYGNKIRLDFPQAVKLCDYLWGMPEAGSILDKLENVLNDYAI